MDVSSNKSTVAALNKGYRIDEMECSACFKHLSLKPIKVYEGGKLKCGRCSQEEDDGVFSELNSYDENQLFKCHNRFAGCRKLLTSSQVRVHEETCRDYICPCPYCPGLPLQSFLLERHFLERHYTYVLEKPVVQIFYGFQSSSFLYKINDFLFMIVFKVDPALGVCEIFNTAVGDKSVALKYYNITMETSNIIEPVEKLHVPTNVQAMQLQLNPQADFKSSLKVTFRYEEFDTPLYEPLPLEPNEVLSEPPELLKEFKIVRSLEIFQDLCARFGIAWPFAFKVLELPTNMFTNDDFFYITEIDNLISTKIFLNCYKCFTSSYNGPMKGIFVKINRSAFFLCGICCEIKIKQNKRIKYNQYISNNLKNLTVRFPKGKNCYSILQLSDFIEDCSKRFDCPFLFCKISGTYLDMSVHIRYAHRVEINNIPFHTVDLRPDVHEISSAIPIVLLVMPFFVVLNFVAKPKGWELHVKFAHEKIVPRQIRLKVVLYNAKFELTHVVYENSECELIPMEKFKFRGQLEYVRNK